jgi:RNA polymerase sigma-70 factor (ECF subfamily)
VSGSLSEAFARGLGTDPAKSLEPELEALVRAARKAVPAVDVDAGVFVAHVAERLGDASSIESALAQIRAEDLYLACACFHGADGAVALFRERFMREIQPAARRAVPAALVDEVCQRVMTKLFVAASSETPAIAKYGGRGSLGAWLQVLTTREGRNALRSANAVREEPNMDRILEAAVDTRHDPELENLKRTYRAQFKAAFQAAFKLLSVRERNILRHEHLDGLDGAKMGALYGVHKSTMSRWRAAARQRLFEETRTYAERELALRPREFESMLRLINSQLDVSLTRLLRAEGEDDDTGRGQ